MTRKEIFDAVRDMRGHGFSIDDELTLDLALDKLGVPKDPIPPSPVRAMIKRHKEWKEARDGKR